MPEPSVHLRQLISAIMRDIAQARVEADYFSKQASDRYRKELPGFTVPRIDISDIGLDIKFIVEKVSQDSKEKSDEVLVKVYKLLDDLAKENLLSLWPVFNRVRDEDRKTIEKDIFKLLRDNYDLEFEDDNDEEALLIFKAGLKEKVVAFFDELTKKGYDPTREPFTNIWINKCIFLDNADNIFLADYNQDPSAPVIINPINQGLGNLVINNIREEEASVAIVNKKPPVYVSRHCESKEDAPQNNDNNTDEGTAMLFMYGKYKLKKPSNAEINLVGPAISIFTDTESSSPAITKIVTGLKDIDVADKNSIITISPPDLEKNEGILAFYSNIDKKLVITDYMTNNHIFNKRIHHEVHWMGFTQGAKYLVLVVLVSEGYFHRYKLRFLPMPGSSLANNNDLFADNHLHSTGWIKSSSTVGVFAFSETDEDNPNFIYGRRNTLYAIPYKGITEAKANALSSWIDSPSMRNARHAVKIDKEHHVRKLTVSPDSSYVAALCFTYQKGSVNRGGVFYIYVYKGDLGHVTTYKVTPNRIKANAAEFRMFYLANNDLVVIRDEEIYNFPHTFDAPSQNEINGVIEDFGSPKVKGAKITNISVKVKENELESANNSLSSLNVNFMVKNYKWEKTIEENTEAGQLIEEMNN